MDSRSAPKRIRGGHLADQRLNAGVDLRPSRPSTRLPLPVPTKSLAVPANDGLRLDDH